MTQRPFFLITNDDGINAPGIRHLWEAVHEFADVAVVAPQVEKSGSGLSITWKKPLHIYPVSWEKNTPAWCVSGTPADCVKMALNTLLPKRPTLIVSGVNRGSNAGRTVLYSGTIGGVIEGTLKDIPGIAFSFSDLDVPPVAATKNHILKIIRHFLEHPLPSGTLLNVNFPLNCKDGVKGIKMAKQGRSYWVESPDKRIHPEGAPYYWLGGEWGYVEEESDSDVALLGEGYISVTPIHVGHLTCQKTFEKHKSLFSEAEVSEDFIDSSTI
jgi:5'-nucleotidase